MSTLPYLPLNGTLPSSGNEPNPVPWQSALWALTALALNSMTLRSSLDPSSMTSNISLLRSSPFICVADCIISLLWILTGWFYGDSAATSIRLMSMGTARGTGDAGEDNPNEATTSVGVIFFVLGPLPQAIKLAGMRGTPWTTACGMVYIITYVMRVVESIAVTRRKRRVGQGMTSWIPSTTVPKLPPLARQRLKTLSEPLAWGCYYFQSFLWFWIFTALTFPESDEESGSGTVTFASLGSFLNSISKFTILYFMGIPGWLLGNNLGDRLFKCHSERISTLRFRKLAQTSTLYGPALLCGISSSTMFGIILLTLYHWYLDSKTPGTAFLKTFYNIEESYMVVLRLLGGVGIAIFLGWVLLIIGIIVTDFESTKRTKDMVPGEAEIKRESEAEMRKTLSLCFAFCNLVSGVLYFRFIYTSVGTVKPRWADMLG